MMAAMSTPTGVLTLGTAQLGLDPYDNRAFIGRDPSASQLAFLDAGLSRRHAEVRPAGGPRPHFRIPKTEFRAMRATCRRNPLAAALSR